MADCPNVVPGLRATRITIATRFGTIGLGGMTVASALLPITVADAGTNGRIVAARLISGFVCMVLGHGFTHAMRTMQALARPAPIERVLGEPALVPVYRLDAS